VAVLDPVMQAKVMGLRIYQATYFLVLEGVELAKIML